MSKFLTVHLNWRREKDRERRLMGQRKRKGKEINGKKEKDRERRLMGKRKRTGKRD